MKPASAPASPALVLAQSPAQNPADEAIMAARRAIVAARNGYKETVEKLVKVAENQANAAKLRHGLLQPELQKIVDDPRSSTEHYKRAAQRLGDVQDAADAAAFTAKLAKAVGQTQRKSMSAVALFGPSGKPAEYHATQGDVGSCWLLSTAGAMAKAHPDAVANLFELNDDYSVNVTLHDAALRLDPATRRVQTYTYTLSARDLSAQAANNRIGPFQFQDTPDVTNLRASARKLWGTIFGAQRERNPENLHEDARMLRRGRNLVKGYALLPVANAHPWLAYLETAAQRHLRAHPYQESATALRNGVEHGTTGLATRILFGRVSPLAVPTAKLDDADLLYVFRTAYKDPITTCTKEGLAGALPEGIVDNHAYQISGVSKRGDDVLVH